MQIVIRPESIEVSSHKRATGVIYFTDNQTAFPEVGWNDFVDVLLLEWSRQLLDFVSGKQEHVTLRFMDGPLAIRLTRDAGGCRAHFEHGNKTVVRESTIEVAELIKSAVIAADGLLTNRVFLAQMPKEAEGLRIVLNQLQKSVPQYRPSGQ